MANLAMQDGPLYRATLASLERRARNLRSALKQLVRALDASLQALLADAQAQAILDQVLQDLSAGSLTSQSDTLKGLYDRQLCTARRASRRALQREVDRAREISERIRGAIERIKGVEERKKSFEADAKRYYDELAKYLARSDPDPKKLAHLDAKQAERAEAFQRLRIEYFAFLEGLVDGEERAVAEWLTSWATAQVEEEEPNLVLPTMPTTTTEATDLHPPPGKPESRTLPAADPQLSPPIQDIPVYIVDAVSAPPPPPSSSDNTLATELLSSDDGHSSAPATSIHSALSRVTTGGGGDSTGSSPAAAAATALSREDEKRRRRRTSLPHFGFGSPTQTPPGSTPKEEKDWSSTHDGGTRERLKGFFRSAHQSISAALPTSPSSSSFAVPPPPPSSPGLLPGGFPFQGSSTAASISTSQVHARPTTSPLPSPRLPVAAPPPPAAESDGPIRRKEGFLFATESGQRHTQSGDGGARYQRFWVVLEDQLTEYDKWTDVMQMHGTPINLRYATARQSRQSQHAGDRRFTFEVLTPEWRRVYQASSEVECREWVEAIQSRVESFLNGTSSIRYFDSSRLQGGDRPLANFGGGDLAAAASGGPASPKSRLPDFLFRRASAGHARKGSRDQSKRDLKRRSQQISIPRLTIGEESGGDGDSFFRAVAASRRGVFALSESDAAAASANGPSSSRLGLNGLGLPFSTPFSVPGATKSSPDLTVPGSPNMAAAAAVRRPNQRSTSAGNGEVVTRLSFEDDRGSELSLQDRAIYDAVRTGAQQPNGGANDVAERDTSASTNKMTTAESKARNARRVAEFAAHSGNDRCADCSAANPKWASWNLGITLCIRCSGVHRSLGTHISKVKSIDLDDWTEEQVTTLEAMGNVRSNAIFEAALPQDAHSALTDATIAPFIREKYVEGRFRKSNALSSEAPTAESVASAPRELASSSM